TLEQPKLPSQAPEVKTSNEQPTIQSKEPFKPTEPKVEPKTATDAKDIHGAAPKSCGEVKDQATLIALGCISQPGARTVAAPVAAPTVTRAVNRAQDDCFSDAVCTDELRAQERERERERI